MRYDLQQKANALNIPNKIIRDAGRTQLESGTATVLAVGPGNFVVTVWVKKSVANSANKGKNQKISTKKRTVYGAKTKVLFPPFVGL